MTKQIMVLVVVFLYVLMHSVFIEPNSLEVTRYTIKDNELHGIRVAFLTDFHLKRKDYKRLDKIVQLTNQQNPDIVLLGGDFANGHSKKNTMNPKVLAQKLSLFTSPAYTVLGNHDWWTDGNLLTKELKDHGIKVLENSNTRIILKRRYVDIVGLADLNTRSVNIAKAFKKTAIPRIVISHNPDVYYDIIDDVSLILAGHTHGGQFVIPFTKPLFVPSKYGSRFASGLVKPTNNTMIISKGLGTSILPIRFNCKPEVVIIDFVKN